MKVWKFKVPRKQITTGEWWTAHSVQRSVAQLRLAFKREAVGIALLERVEVIEATSTPGLIRIKMRYPANRRDQYEVDTCLTDLGIDLVDPVVNQQG